MLQEYDDTGSLLREFIHAAGHTQPLAMIDYTAAGSQAAGVAETFYYLLDERGSVTAITDSAGEVVESYRYDAYGGAYVYDGAGTLIASWIDNWDDAALTPSALGNPYGFTGHRFSVAGLYETPFRAYSPYLGRWLQRDPLGYVDGVNLYEYVYGDPIGWIDLFGLHGVHLNPMGVVINSILKPVGDTEYQEKIRRLLEKLKRMDARTRARIEALERSKYKHTIRLPRGGAEDPETITPASEKNARNGRGSGSRTFIDPDKTVKTPDGVFDPLEILAHELSHAEDIDEGKFDTDPAGKGRPPVTEEKAVREQNRIRVKQGDKPRDKYGGVPVPDPVPPDARPKTDDEDSGEDNGKPADGEC